MPIEDQIEYLLWNEKSADQILEMLEEERLLVLERIKNINRGISEMRKELATYDPDSPLLKK